MRPLSVALLLAAVGLTACSRDDLTSKTPILFEADRAALPAIRDGVWAGRGCEADPAQDFPAWGCGDAFIVRRGRPVHPDDMAQSDQALMTAMRVGVAPDFQIAQTGPSDPGAGGYYSYAGIDRMRFDEQGRVIALQAWDLKCGPPPPEGSTTPGGKPRHQTLEPYPGVVVEEGGCAPMGRAGLIAAAAASRVDPKGNHDDYGGWRWVREERPGDWVEAQPLEKPAEAEK